MIEPKSAFPVFTVEDPDAAKSFYTDNFGFDVVFSGDWYIHLVSKSGIQVGFPLPDQLTQPPIFQTPTLEKALFSAWKWKARMPLSWQQNRNHLITYWHYAPKIGDNDTSVSRTRTVFTWTLFSLLSQPKHFKAIMSQSSNLTDLQNFGAKLPVD